MAATSIRAFPVHPREVLRPVPVAIPAPHYDVEEVLRVRRMRSLLFQMLSEFEWQVLSGYEMGKSYREIACELECKTKSVDNALMRIKRKVTAASGEGVDWPFVE